IIIIWWLVMASLPAVAQERVYPVIVSRDIPVVLNSDRSAFVLEKSFKHKLTLGYPGDDRVFDADPQNPVLMLWLRFQNISGQRAQLDVAKFSSTDDQGRVYSALALEDVTNRIIAAASGPTLGTKTLRNLSLGRAGNKPTEDQ